MAVSSEALRVCRQPTRNPEAQKSLDRPHTTCSRSGSSSRLGRPGGSACARWVAGCDNTYRIVSYCHRIVIVSSYCHTQMGGGVASALWPWAGCSWQWGRRGGVRLAVRDWPRTRRLTPRQDLGALEALALAEHAVAVNLVTARTTAGTATHTQSTDTQLTTPMLQQSTKFQRGAAARGAPPHLTRWTSRLRHQRSISSTESCRYMVPARRPVHPSLCHTLAAAGGA
jgi:hypothetical protein